MSQALDPNVVRRLAFIRFLYTQGLEQARRPQPLAATALPNFHDAVEMFLLLTAEHLQVNLAKGTTFDSYWDQIEKQSGTQLPGRPAMRRMNNSRVNFKHHGSIPSATDLEQFRGDVTTFLTDATRLLFGADFLSLDMIDLVTQQDAVTRLRQAEEHAGRGDCTEALALLSEAFDDLLSDYAGRKRTASGSTPYAFGPEHGLGRVIGRADSQYSSKLGSRSTHSLKQSTRCSGPSGCSPSAWTTAATRGSRCSCPGSPASWMGAEKYGRCRASRPATRSTSSAGSS